jgi:phosphoenolpyruvate carboxylase
MLLKVSGFKKLMQDEPANMASIETREKIILPLFTIQQYAIQSINKLSKSSIEDLKKVKVYEKIITRSLFGNINASRNSA